MKDFSLDILKYHHRFNRQLLDEILIHESSLPETDYIFYNR